MIPTFEEVMVLTDTISNRSILQIAECQAMYDALAELPAGAVVVEVGCDIGRSSSLLYQMAKAKEFTTVHIEPWLWDSRKAKVWMEMMCERNPYHPFVVLRMKTVEAAMFIPLSIDLAFIDGSHDVPDVEIDLAMVATKVRLGGFLTVHDYPSGGVTETVDRFIADGGWVKVNQAGGFGVWRRA